MHVGDDNTVQENESQVNDIGCVVDQILHSEANASDNEPRRRVLKKRNISKDMTIVKLN